MPKGWLKEALNQTRKDAERWPELQTRVRAGGGEFALRPGALQDERQREQVDVVEQSGHPEQPR